MARRIRVNYSEPTMYYEWLDRDPARREDVARKKEAYDEQQATIQRELETAKTRGGDFEGAGFRFRIHSEED